MSSHHHLSDASHPEPDALLEQLAEYVLATEAITSARRLIRHACA